MTRDDQAGFVRDLCPACLAERTAGQSPAHRVSHFTEGPWTLIQDPRGWTLHSNGRDITAEPFDCTEDDARLIAAAPELLAACKRALLLVELEIIRDDSTPSVSEQIRRAIAAAEERP